MSASRSVVEHAAAAVAAQQQPVTGGQLDVEQVGLGVVDAVDGLEDEVAVRVDPRLLLGDPALVDQALDEGVVLGELARVAVAQQVAALSPTWPIADPAPSKSATVAVVLVPSSAGSSSTSSAIRSWARWIAPASASSMSSSRAPARRAGAASGPPCWLAMSPRAAPPTPSQR